jgi:hypothetical protein
MKKMILFLILALLIYGFYAFKFAEHYPENIDLEHKPDYFGVTFSTKFSKEIGLNWKEVYTAILDNLNVKYIRIPVYWDEIEETESEFNFADYDYIFNEGKTRDVKFIATIGARLPRWPECHTPKWIEGLDTYDIQEKTLLMLERTVNHFKSRPEIIYWQIENEPLLDFYGMCPDGDFDFLKREIDLVRRLDDRKIIITASGELSTWSKEPEVADIFGTTIYRVVWASWFGYSRYPIPTWFYNYKADRVGITPENRIITELQLEPWTPNGKIIDLKPEEYNKSMSMDQFKANIQYAIDMDWNQAYAWGVEWWYWQYKNGDPEYWETAKKMFI